MYRFSYATQQVVKAVIALAIVTGIFALCNAALEYDIKHTETCGRTAYSAAPCK